MCLRSTAGDRLGAVNRGRRLGSLPLRVCCAVLTLWCVGASAADGRVVPYAGSRGSVTSLTRTELRDIFFARLTKWPNGDPIRVFVLPDRHPLHVRFSFVLKSLTNSLASDARALYARAHKLATSSYEREQPAAAVSLESI
jgi:hypothetical protein